MEEFENDGVIDITSSLKKDLQSDDLNIIRDAVLRDEVCVLYPSQLINPNLRRGFLEVLIP